MPLASSMVCNGRWHLLANHKLVWYLDCLVKQWSFVIVENNNKAIDKYKCLQNNEHFQNISFICKVVSKETKFLKSVTIGKTDQSHVYKIKCCLEEHFQRVP